MAENRFIRLCESYIGGYYAAYRHTNKLPEGAFGYFVTLLRNRGIQSGLSRYYSMAEKAFRKPAEARRILQHLICNYDSILTQSSIFAYEMLYGISEPRRLQQGTAEWKALSEMYGRIVNEAVSEGQFLKLEEILPKFSDPDGTYRSAFDAPGIRGNSGLDYYSNAGLFKFLSGYDGRQFMKANHRTISDNGHLAAVIISITVFAHSKNREAILMLDDIIKQRHALIHDDVMRRPAHSTLNDTVRLADGIKSLYPGIDEETLLSLYHIAILMMMPFFIYEGEAILRGKDTMKVLGGSRLWVRIQGLFMGRKRHYGYPDPLENYSGDTAGRKAAGKSRRTDYSASTGVGVSLRLALFAGAMLIMFRGCTNWAHEHAAIKAGDDHITLYMDNKTKYDDALLYKERMETVRKHPELKNPDRERHLLQRARTEGWPEPSWYKTLWHIGTPNRLHTDYMTWPGDYAATGAQGMPDLND